MKFTGMTTMAILALLLTAQTVLSQTNLSRIHYANKDIFISGINIAWVNFAGDLGPDPPNLGQFQTEFQTVHNNGGNVMRFWLHTNGTKTPIFDANGYVTGPGPVAISNLRQILDLAHQNDIGLILCLWSHDMLNQSEMDTNGLHRNAKLLTDTAYTNAYIRNTLIPMVDSVKGHPAIVAWEIFNEPEGITDEFGWSGRDHVPMASIQVCVNLITAAIHREDPTALVTSGALTFATLTDVNPSASVKSMNMSRLNSMQPSQLEAYIAGFNARHRLNLTADEYLAYIAKVSALPYSNYYRDDRLIAAGGDGAGVLDLYCVHYYAQGPSLSPFVHPASYWGLTKPVVAAEFYTQTTDQVPGLGLYPWLYANGYAGAMAWSWTDFGNPITNSMADTWTSLQYLFTYFRNDVLIFPKTGTIYRAEAVPSTIEKTDSTKLIWDVEPGSTVTMDGTPVNVKDSIVVAPLVTKTYAFIAAGEVTDTAAVTVSVLPTGKIVSFRSIPEQLGTGESATLIWHVVKGSTATLNGGAVPVIDTLVIHPDASNSTYTLRAAGDISDSATITFTILPPDQVDRASGAVVTTSSNDTVTYSFSKPQNMVDGNNFTRWQAAANPTTQWVQLDMGIPYTINTIIIRWGNRSYARLYSVQSSNDLNQWTSLATVRAGTGGANYVETLDNLNGAGRYLYFNLLSPGSGAYSIAEIYVYGVPAPAGIESAGGGIPTAYSLSQNYPNPFNPTTDINFSLVKTSGVRLTIYNILGQIVDVPIDTQMNRGFYAVSFNAGRLASGVYFYRLEAGNFVSTKKMLLLK